MRLRSAVLALAVAVAVAGRPSITAQVRDVYDLGADGLVQALERLQTTASVLHTGAHPDDEDSAFLARAARGDHARVGYLSLNRGEGGQNIIGPELFDALGVIRTEELLQARRLDGAQQFFTRTFDYGFSKSREEAAAKWNEHDVLGDMVRIIRLFRPLVIYSRFTGTPADGHGHHQLAGYLTPLAFKAAADPNEYPEQLAEGLRPWQAKKLYRGVGFRPDPANPPTIEVQTGIVDPVIGRTYSEIASQGRSQHKSQEMGSIEPLGPAQSGLHLLQSLVQEPAKEQSIFDGIDTTVPGLAALAGLPPGSLASQLQAMDTAAKQALAQYQPRDPARLIPTLANGLRATREARTALTSLAASAGAKADADFLLAFKERDFEDALVRAARVVVDPLSDTETVVAGGMLGVDVRTFAANPALVTIGNVTLHVPDGWRAQLKPPADGRGGRGGRGGGPAFRRETPTSQAEYQVTVAADAPLTEPYFLRLPRKGDSYQWPAGSPKGLPFDPPLVTASVVLQIGGEAITVTRPVEYRYADRVRGEVRREVNVVPAVAVGLDTPLLIVPLGTTPRQSRLVVRATSFAPGRVSGTLRLQVPKGWTATPSEAPFTLGSNGDKISAPFTVTAPAGRVAGEFAISAEAVVGPTRYTQDVDVIEYPHIQTHRIYSPATATAQVLALKVAPVKVGYIMGSGDEVPDALRRMGVSVTMIDDDMLATGDLSQFDTIVVGIRASEARTAYVANHARLLQYMQDGGTMIVQYQQGVYETRNLPPYPAQAPTNSRVTDETAAVRILAPQHPVFTFPNRITEKDFDGWVQERNLYAFNTFDSRYTPLLESH
ncbi:MAG TPA: PIG-L family deacetylase, partial [Vicinamibacterales bacterium]|nr:PIG-L family deacetylase [Vicinamibacterales bacterium]